MDRIKALFIWLWRCGYSRGFGIQSPTDYRFVRYVINEHYPYYAYDDIKNEYQDSKWLANKLGRLYFRIANFVQPQNVLIYNLDLPIYNIYVRAGCKKAVIATEMSNDVVPDMIIANISDGFHNQIDSILNYLRHGSVLVLENIKANHYSRQCWEHILNDDRAMTTFDLYYAGIVLFDDKRYRQHYKINF